MKTLALIIKGVILLLFLAMAVSNTQTVSFFYLPGQSIELPLIVVLFGAFVIGIVFGMFALFGRLLRLRSETNRLRAEVKKNGSRIEPVSAPAAAPAASSTPVVKE